VSKLGDDGFVFLFLLFFFSPLVCEGRGKLLSFLFLFGRHRWVEIKAADSPPLSPPPPFSLLFFLLEGRRGPHIFSNHFVSLSLPPLPTWRRLVQI